MAEDAVRPALSADVSDTFVGNLKYLANLTSPDALFRFGVRLMVTIAELETEVERIGARYEVEWRDTVAGARSATRPMRRWKNYGYTLQRFARSRTRSRASSTPPRGPRRYAISRP